MPCRVARVSNASMLRRLRPSSTQCCLSCPTGPSLWRFSISFPVYISLSLNLLLAILLILLILLVLLSLLFLDLIISDLLLDHCRQHSTRYGIHIRWRTCRRRCIWSDAVRLRAQRICLFLCPRDRPDNSFFDTVDNLLDNLCCGLRAVDSLSERCRRLLGGSRSTRL